MLDRVSRERQPDADVVADVVAEVIAEVIAAQVLTEFGWPVR